MVTLKYKTEIGLHSCFMHLEMAEQCMDAHQLSRSLTENDIKNYLKRVASWNKHIPADSVAAASISATVGISNSDVQLSLDEILASETKEILSRAATEISQLPGKINQETMNMVVEVFVNRVSSLLTKISEVEPSDSFSCTLCWELLHEPITLRCGHTFCKNCLKASQRCKECKTKVDTKECPSPNVLLTSILQKLFSMDYVVRSLTVEGDELMQKSCHEAAITKYMDATEFGIQSTQAVLGRAKVFQLLGNHEGALQDAMSITTFKRNSVESLMAKGDILLKEGREVEALLCFLSCLSMNPSARKPMQHAKEILHRLLSKGFALCDPEAKRRKMSECECDTATAGSSIDRDDAVLETLLCSLMRDLDISLLSEGNLKKYFDSDGKNNKDILSKLREFDNTLVNPSDFECSLCMMLFFNPVCTPCGHSFCRDCLERSLDHNNVCPLCKGQLSLKVEKQKLYSPSLDICLASIIRQILPDEYQERLEIQHKEIRTLRSSTPIFVCTLAYPTMPCPLHIFEPKYRLMLRRAVDIHDGKFGIGVPSEDKPFEEFGTMVNIKNVSFFPDGRSVVESEGFSRFKTIESGIKDGYNTAKVEYIVDTEVTCPKELDIIEKLSKVIYQGSKTWYMGIDESCKESIRLHFKDFPERDIDMGANGPHWLWWVLAVLPVQDKVKCNVLSRTSLKQRLLIVHKLLKLLQKPKNTV